MIATDDPEAFWAALLSEDEREVLAAWASVKDDAELATGALRHLEKMADPAEGYADVQQRAARAALAVIRGTRG